MRFLSPEEVARLAEAITPRYRSLVYTAAYTGLRWGELAALKVERLNLLRGSVDVVEAVAEVNGYLHFGPTKTGARRTVSMPRFLCDMLGEHLTQNGAPAHGLAFTSAKGKPLRRTSTVATSSRPCSQPRLRGTSASTISDTRAQRS
jgi:integrase